MVLSLPCLWVGWIGDDHFHRLAMTGSSRLPDLPCSPMALFTFADGDPERNVRLMDLGLWPWWTLKEIHGAFFRPLTALTHWMDYRLWPNRPALMHLQSWLWFGGCVAAAGLLYRRMLGGTLAAGLAALLFAVDDAHSTPIGFLANRNALLALFFGLLAVSAHDRWRRNGWRMGAWLGPTLLGASLLSAEMGVATMGYLFAHAMFLDPGGRRSRWASLLPYLGVTVLWRMVWTRMGAGGWGMEIYVDPLVEPWRYVTGLLWRAPVCLLAQWAVPPAELIFLLASELSKRSTVLLGAAIFAFVGVMAVVVTPLLKRDAAARFWALGMLLALLPVCAVFPADRLLMFAGVGAMGLLAQFLIRVFGGDGALGAMAPHYRRAAKRLGVFLVVVHGVLAPLLLPLRTGMPLGPKSFFDSIHIHTPLDGSVERQSVVIVNSPVAMAAGYLAINRALAGEPVPAHTRILAPSWADVTVTRPDAFTLVVRPKGGYLRHPMDQLARGKCHPLALGERVELTGFTAQVTALTDDRRPAEVAFRFDVPLEDASLRWLHWKDNAYVPFTPPPIGHTLYLPFTRPRF
ncbi:MAG: hypothetical protein V2A79_03415 [Planctomycetota bacterium]